MRQESRNWIQVRSGPRFRLDVPMGAIVGCRLVEHEFEGMVRSVHQAES
jgi:hypothetical protein